MSEETIIGPHRCHRCGGEYGEHDSGCTESKEHKELTRLHAELATARSERDEWKRSAEGYNAEWLAARRELDEARRTVERLRAALEQVASNYDESTLAGTIAREALATPAPVVPPAMHASAPPGHKCSDCTIDQEPCPTCYEAWWKKKHPHHHLIESPVVPLADAEALATALQQIHNSELGYTEAPFAVWDRLTDIAKNVLATYRSRHPVPKEPPQ